jgi:hypothetical protein
VEEDSSSNEEDYHQDRNPHHRGIPTHFRGHSRDSNYTLLEHSGNGRSSSVDLPRDHDIRSRSRTPTDVVYVNHGCEGPLPPVIYRHVKGSTTKSRTDDSFEGQSEYNNADERSRRIESTGSDERGSTYFRNRRNLDEADSPYFVPNERKVFDNRDPIHSENFESQPKYSEPWDERVDYIDVIEEIRPGRQRYKGVKDIGAVESTTKHDRGRKQGRHFFGPPALSPEISFESHGSSRSQDSSRRRRLERSYPHDHTTFAHLNTRDEKIVITERFTYRPRQLSDVHEEVLRNNCNKINPETRRQRMPSPIISESKWSEHSPGRSRSPPEEQVRAGRATNWEVAHSYESEDVGGLEGILQSRSLIVIFQCI